MNEENVISLFDGDPDDEETVQIWQGDDKDIMVMINGKFMYVTSEKGLENITNALNVANTKLKLNNNK